MWQVDLEDSKSVAEMAKKVAGKVDVLVKNAGAHPQQHCPCMRTHACCLHGLQVLRLCGLAVSPCAQASWM